MGRQRSCTNLWRRFPPDPAKMGRASGYISGHFAIGSSDFFSFSDDDFVYTDPEAYSPLTRLAAGPSDLDLLGWSAFSTRPSIAAVLVPFAAAIRRFSRKFLKEQIGVLMPRRYCGSCRSPLHADDGHSECVSAWGNPMQMPRSLALIVLTARASVSPLCARGSLSFQRVTLPPRALPFSSSQGPVRKKTAGQRILSARLRASSRRLRSRVSRSRHTERFLPSFFSNLTSIPLQARAIWSRSGEVTMSWPMTACHWQLQMLRSLSGSITDPAPHVCPRPAPPKPGWMPNFSVSSQKRFKELGLEWSPPEEPSRSRLDEWFLPGRRQAPQQRPSPFFPEVHDELTRSWRSPYSARLRTSASSAPTTIDGAEEKGYERMPQLDESVAAHLCPPTAIGWKAKTSHLSKPCRTTSALAGRSYASAGQAASALHSMAVLQVYQAKLLSAVDESEPDPATLRELRSATDLALRATKTTAQAIGRSMASLVVLERHLWLTLTEIKDADRVSFLDAPISPSASLDLRWKDSLSASQRHRRRHRLCDTSCPSAPAQQLLRVAPGLRRLSSPRNLHLSFPPLSLLGLSSREGVHAQPDATPLRSARAPDPR